MSNVFKTKYPYQKRIVAFIDIIGFKNDMEIDTKREIAHQMLNKLQDRDSSLWIR